LGSFRIIAGSWTEALRQRREKSGKFWEVLGNASTNLDGKLASFREMSIDV
jgi:hypothetical protein